MLRKAAVCIVVWSQTCWRAALVKPKGNCLLETFWSSLSRDCNTSRSFSLQNSIMAQPKLIVFDLDYTLWPFWVDTHVDPPFHMASNGKVYDAHKQHVRYYEDVPLILAKLHSEGFMLGIASRTGATQEAADLTRLFNWDQFFHYRQIYPGSKITHFKKLHAQSGIPYEDMLFFDDEHRNIVDVSSLGVTCMFVPDGVNNKSFKEGMELFKTRKQSTSGRS